MLYTSHHAASGMPKQASSGMPKQHLRAYRFWHIENKPMDEMCRALSTRGRDDPLKVGTVVSYILGALAKDASLPFDKMQLRELASSDAGSWGRWGEFVEGRCGGE
ncbi:hypothetical protein EV121DRAFT_204077 [Schizophyllum commune]